MIYLTIGKLKFDSFRLTESRDFEAREKAAFMAMVKAAVRCFMLTQLRFGV